MTAVTAQRGDPERVNIFIDEEFAFGVAADLALEAGLYAGNELDGAGIAALLARDETRKATSAALRLLAHRARAEGELIRRLRQKGFAEEAIDGAIAKLREWRYLDDADFARRWVESRQQHRPRGTRLLGQELRQKGVDAETIDEAIAAADLDEDGDALRLARQKAPTYARLPPEVQRRRLSSFLARRGYSFDLVRRAVEEALGEDS
ncbi:MAG: RecX family transcriptional regulator [Chloroflexia bacterium]|nr:RecX family transcriptional regulator [Chloroflexia bacterium]